MAKRKINEKIKKDFVLLSIHKLKTPLSSIKLSLGMLLDGSFGKVSNEQKDIIKKIYQRNNMLIYLVNDLLNIVKIEGKARFQNKILVDFENLIQSVIDYNQEEIKKKKIVFKFKRPEIKLQNIILDKEEVFLAIQNIFDNAVKYTLIGGEIMISLGSDSKNLNFKIQDSGIGIPEYEKEKLFTKFFRGSNAMKTETTGSGLGLFIAKDIIEKNHGKIWFESKENKGSIFFVTFPIK